MRMTSVAAAALAVAISAFPAAHQASAQPAADTMGAIKERGYLLCGVAGNNVGLEDGEIILTPNAEQRQKSDLQLTVAGTAEKVCMIEAGANEVDDDTMLEAIMKGFAEVQKMVAFIKEVQAEILDAYEAAHHRRTGACRAATARCATCRSSSTLAST